MTPRGLVIAVICLTVVCLTIALSFFSLGLWLVLPFSGLEIFVVGIVVGYTIRRSDDYEIILVTDEYVVVTKQKGRSTRQEKFQRGWVRVHLQPGATRLQPNRLIIGSHGRFVEIGKEATQGAREELASRLNRILRKRYEV